MSRRFKLKTLPDGRALINLGCGFRTHSAWNNLDFSPYARLARRKLLASAARHVGVISQIQYERIRDMDSEVLVWDLRRGIPFADETFDVVYHSHFLEHLPREAALPFLAECFRTLKVGGILRIVVPDLETLFGMYAQAVQTVTHDRQSALEQHRAALEEIFDQMVRTRPGTDLCRHGRLPAFLMGLLRGDARRTGEIHQWMYDRVSLGNLMERAGLVDILQHTAFTSSTSSWRQYGLDGVGATPYKRHSLYMEGRKPAAGLRHSGSHGDQTSRVAQSCSPGVEEIR
jgi:SAM-dependent methyltransferase